MTALLATVPGVRIESVKVGERARKDYGDLTSLKDSIAEHGLLQPIVLLPDDYLLCGGRRLEACKQLGWDAIPFVRVADQGDALSRLKAERDENTCRKEMTPSELVSIGRKLEELKRPEAELRQRSGTSGPAGPDPSDGHAVRREVAEALGMGESLYRRARRVVDAAEDESAPEEVRLAAIEAQAEMDSGAISVSRADIKVGEAIARHEPQRKPEAERVEEISALATSGMTSGQIGKQIGIGEHQVREYARKNGIEIVADRVMSRSRRGVDSNHIVSGTITALEGLLIGIRLINYDDLDETQVENWADSLSSPIRELNRFVKKIKEKTQ